MAFVDAVEGQAPVPGEVRMTRFCMARVGPAGSWHCGGVVLSSAVRRLIREGGCQAVAGGSAKVCR
ncbi:hypothetical protein BU198_00350 [Streptomyces sp. CBMA156]|nr:hypothetical protein [Streptomyces sp. CBMA156]